MDTRQEIIEIIKQMPGLTTPELHQFFPHIGYHSFSSMVSGVYFCGGIRREKVAKQNKYRYFADESAAPEAKPHKVKVPTDSALKLRLEEAQEKIKALEAWKEGAISRFPALAVDPDVMKAREIVSERLKLSGDFDRAKSVMDGESDNKLLILAVVDAIRELGQ